MTGDTKVVNRRSADKLFITTTGIGIVPDATSISASDAKPGDVVILSGTIGDHGMAVMSRREGWNSKEKFCPIPAAAPPRGGDVSAGEIHALRDPTRGGLGTSLCEIAAASKIGVEIHSSAIPVREPVRGACELLGIDPLFVANEGKLVAFVHPDRADAVLSAMRATEEGRDSAIIGSAVEQHPNIVLMKTEIGGTRILDLPLHEQLPRIC